MRIHAVLQNFKVPAPIVHIYTCSLLEPSPHFHDPTHQHAHPFPQHLQHRGPTLSSTNASHPRLHSHPNDGIVHRQEGQQCSFHLESKRSNDKLRPTEPRLVNGPDIGHVLVWERLIWIHGKAVLVVDNTGNDAVHRSSWKVQVPPRQTRLVTAAILGGMRWGSATNSRRWHDNGISRSSREILRADLVPDEPTLSSTMLSRRISKVLLQEIS
jgi:hypothetical protein